MAYGKSEKKELYIANNDPKQPILIYRDEGPWPNLPSGCWAPPDVIEYYHIDWNNPNSAAPFITQVTGGTILRIDLAFLKISRRITRPTYDQRKVIHNYGFYKMLTLFEQERIDAGWWEAGSRNLYGS
jgi:hypothetical protein